MQKEPKSIIISKLRERGCRITRQRRIILDIILDEDCSCCKEIYYKACKQDSSIGAATVYRMVNTLEEIGVINRKNMYKYTGSDIDEELECVPCCRMELDDGTVLQLSGTDLWTGKLWLYDWKKNCKIHEQSRTGLLERVWDCFVILHSSK